MKTTPSRRSFLKLAAACTAPAFGSLAFAAPQTQQKFDKVADVIVIGSGFAGLAAALEAKEKGASVMLLEKMPAYRRTSAMIRPSTAGLSLLPALRFRKKKASRTLLNSCSRT